MRRSGAHKHRQVILARIIAALFALAFTASCSKDKKKPTQKEPSQEKSTVVMARASLGSTGIWFPIPANWTKRVDPTREVFMEGPGGFLAIRTVTDADIIDPGRLKLETERAAREMRGKVTFSGLVAFADRASIRIDAEEAEDLAVRYVVPDSYGEELSVDYFLEPAVADAVAGELAALEDRTRFASLPPDKMNEQGKLGITPLVALASWKFIDEDGGGVPVVEKGTDTPVESVVFGAPAMLLGGEPNSALIIKPFWKLGTITHAKADEYIDQLRTQGELEVISQRLIDVSFSPEKAARISLRRKSKRAAIDYLIRDELWRTWIVTYQFPESQLDIWTKRLARLEKTTTR